MMGPCEVSAEVGCVSPQVFVGDRTVGVVVDNAVSEGFVERAMEPLLSLCVSSPTTDKGETDPVTPVVAQQHKSSDSGDGVSEIEDGKTGGSLVRLHCVENTQVSIEMADLECADGPREVVHSGLGKRLDESIVVPLSGLDLSSQAPRYEIDRSSGDGYCNMNDSSGLVVARDEIAGDFCRDTNDTESEPISKGSDIKCEPSDNNNPGSGKGSSIECRLNGICPDEGLCKSGVSSCVTNLRVEGELSSEIPEVAGGPSICMVYAKSSCDNLIGRNLAEAVSVKSMDNESSNILLTQDTLLNLSGGVAVPNLTYVAEILNKADNIGNDNGDKCEMNCPGTGSLPLRRSSRCRKTVQRVQSGESATRCRKKASKDSIHRPVDLLSGTARKKRSSYSRLTCTSGWGAFEKLSKYFPLSNEDGVKQVMDQATRKKKTGKRRGKKDALKVVERSSVSEVKQEVPCRPIRLKVTFGKNDKLRKEDCILKSDELGKEDCIPPGVVDFPGFQPGNDNKLESFCSIVESSGGNVMDSLVLKEIPRLMQCGNSALNVQLTSSNMDTCSVSGKTSWHKSSHLDFEKQDGSCAAKLSDPGTSPDSEVIDQQLDSTIGPKDFSSLHDFVHKASYGKSGPRSHCSFTKKSKNRRNKKDKLCQTTKRQHDSDRAKMSACPCNNADGKSEKHPSITAGSELVLTEELAVAVEDSSQIQNLDNVAGINVYSRTITGLESASGNSCKLLTPAEACAKKNSKGSKIKGKSRNKSTSNGEIGLQKDTSGQKKGKKKLTNKQKVQEIGFLGDAYEIGGHPGTENQEAIDIGETEFSKEVAADNASCLHLIPTGVGGQTLAPRVAWVCCDDCLKWRCIPAVLADIIDLTNCRWTCKDNQDQAFADCSIPQEKSNAEINAELQISDEEDARDGHLGSKGSGLKQVVASQQSTWMLIKSNIFLHRNRKTQTMDEIMVCHCKPPVDGSLGCGSHCLNRMLNIECVQGTCPCGDLCSNQQFQRRQYAKLSWLRCGKKGFGLQVLQDISEGQFLIEYVGEVLDLQTYEARQQDYASKGHKHFYFMTLNGNEVIDASAKGNLGRFVNHSCDPNCRTEKWVVNGEISVGLFALRNIKKGEELTFDYNYVRVFGAAAKKCHCGSRKCRGYIGGDPLNAEIIVHGDSDEEFPEPIVVNENGEIDHSLRDLMVKSNSQDIERVVNGKTSSEEMSEIIVEHRVIASKMESSVDDSELGQTVPRKESIDEVRESTDSSAEFQPVNLRMDHISSVKIDALSTEHTTGTPTSSPKSDVLHVENTFQKSISSSFDSSGRVSEVEVKCEPHARPCPRMKISRPSKSVKNRKSSCNSASVGKVLSPTQKPKVLSCKSKRLLEGSASGHHEEVEKNLNELLDADGGICKKKDASKGYLKLLLLTAASGDCGNGGSIQSNRILSMILDAMLKTKSRGVLQDIINKNGLQMLHNMMKLYRRDFKKIPILRKLLKVLEFLAEKEILTVERINVDSVHPGVESFRESILFFTEHDDNQVHQIARSFRDRWIPHARKFIRMEKNDRWREYQRGSNSTRLLRSCHHWQEQGAMAVEHLTHSDQSGSMTNQPDARIQEPSSPLLFDGRTIVIINRPRKRKSRWDQPVSPKENGKIPKVENCEGQMTVAFEIKKEENNCYVAQNITSHSAEDMTHISDDDAPPGFSSPPGFSLCPVPLGLLQTRFNPNLPVAYGIPLPMVQKFGTPHCETMDSWEIAPAMPFQPFPPLPSYPRDKRPMVDHEEVRQGYHIHGGDQNLPSTSGATNQNTVATNENMLHHGRDPRNFLGKRYYRQKNWINSKRRPPWFRNLDGWGFKGNYPPHSRNGSFQQNHGNGSE